MEKVKMVQLKDVCEFINGDRGVNYPKADELVDEGIPFINAGHIQNGSISFEDMNYITQEKYDKLSSGKVNKGDIVYCLRGSLGKHATITFDTGAVASSLVIMRPRTIILSDYLAYVLDSTSINTQMIKANNGSSQPNLSATSVKEFVVPLPSLKMQEKIISIMDKAKSLVTMRRQQIQGCDELIKSQFIEMFGDPITNSKELPRVPLGEICNMKAGKSIKAADIFECYDDEMFPCYGGNGLRGYVKEYTHEGNIPLIGRQGALCGNVQFAQGKFYATEHAIVTQPKVELNTCWLFIMLREMNLNRLASGAAQPGLNVSTLVPLEVIKPPIELQHEFAQFVQQVDKLKFGMEQSLKELEANFDSLMQRAFKGELF